MNYLTILIVLLLMFNQFQALNIGENNLHENPQIENTSCSIISMLKNGNSSILNKTASILISKLYDDTMGLFRETWGSVEGKCWYWNTEQGEALLALTETGYLNSSLRDRSLASYLDQFVYFEGSNVWLFTRYTSCERIRILSLDKTDFSIGNYIVNIGGDLEGGRREGSSYYRVIALGMDTYSSTRVVNGEHVAWPLDMYVANIRSPEVYYNSDNDSSYYKGIWDTRDGSLGTGKIVYSEIDANDTMAVIRRTMSDGILEYSQIFLIAGGKPYVDVLLKARNIYTSTLQSVRISFAFDNLDWWRYDKLFIPGHGYFDSNNYGTATNNDNREYIFTRWGQSDWSQYNGWLPSILYSSKPMGLNRAVIVLIESSQKENVSVWGYGSLNQEYDKWYYRWIKYDFLLGDLEPGENITIRMRIIPLSSYPTGLEDMAIRLAVDADNYTGVDLSYAFNTGTGPFHGLVVSSANNTTINRIILGVGGLLARNNFSVSTRILANYLASLAILYYKTGNRTILEQAIDIGNEILERQIRDVSSPLNGGFLDYPHPYGIASYVDVNAEVAKALLLLHKATGDTKYLGAVDYMVNTWFKTIGGGIHVITLYKPSIRRIHLEELDSYALGYLVYALAPYYWNNSIVLIAQSLLWSRLTDEYWVPATINSTESNTETLSAFLLAQYEFTRNMEKHTGITIEYAAPPAIVIINHTRNYQEQTRIIISSYTQRYVYLLIRTVNTSISEIMHNNTLIPRTDSLTELCTSQKPIYYDNNQVVILKATPGEIILGYNISKTLNANEQNSVRGNEGLLSHNLWINVFIIVVIILTIFIYFHKNRTH